MVDVPKELTEIAERLGRGERIRRRKLETLLEWFGALRRGRTITAQIQAALENLGLETDPSFVDCEADSLLYFRLKSIRNSDSIIKSLLNSKPEITEEGNDSDRRSSLDTNSDEEEGVEGDIDVDDSVPDARPVTSQPADWTIQSLREMYEEGTLILQPEYQREYVWNQKPDLPSRLIESTLLQIPIPALYFGNVDGGKLEVIDGQQRLTTFIKFLRNEFQLKGLTSIRSLNGKTFNMLDKEHQRKIRNTPIRTIQIDAGSNTDLKYEIFERLNRGSIALNEQELRNCIYRGPFNDLLAELETDLRWRRVKGGETPEPRYKEQEMILRLLALGNNVARYRGGLKRFLNEFMAAEANADERKIADFEKSFRETMQNVYTVFGANSGRLYIAPLNSKDRDGRWDNKFSITALEIQAAALWNQNTQRVQKVADQIREAFLHLILTDKKIQDSISRATGGNTPTKLRWTAFKTIVQPLLDEVELEPRFFKVEFRNMLFNKCAICGLCKNTIHHIDDSVVDHVIPFSKGGKTVPENAQLAHRSCNAVKYCNLIIDHDLSSE